LSAEQGAADSGSALSDRGRLLVSCPDRRGIVAAVSKFLYERNANIVHSDQHSTDPSDGQFFLRVEFDLPELQRCSEGIESDFAAIGDDYSMVWRLALAGKRKRLAIFVSREDHCLLELLWQHQAGDLQADIVLVVGNHPELANIAEQWGIPFAHIPTDLESRRESEEKQLALLGTYLVDLVVLARYMQVLSPAFVARWPYQIINIHHSFLPAFVGAKPYSQALERGVKLIGATAHYVNSELDAGPIVEQDVHRVDHRHNVRDLRRMGRQIERTVLARAVSWHVEDRILVYGDRTVVFS
jgi:formyltetrahydrofolate deformylase